MANDFMGIKNDRILEYEMVKRAEKYFSIVSSSLNALFTES